MALSALLSLAVVALLGQALSSSLASITILWAYTIGSLFLNERVTRIDAAVMVFLVCGAVLVVVGKLGFTPSTTPFLSANDIESIFSGRRQLGLGLALGAVSVCTLALAESKRACGASTRVLLAFRLVLCGIFGATTGVASKGFSTLAASMIADSTSDGIQLAAVFLIGLLASVILQLRYLGESLKIAPLNAVVPIYQAALVLGGAASGIAFWNEEISSVGLFFGGVACIVCGLALRVRVKLDDPTQLETAPAPELAPEQIVSRVHPRRRNSAPALLESSSKSVTEVRMPRGAASQATLRRASSSSSDDASSASL
jgi:hypothetical protein